MQRCPSELHAAGRGGLEGRDPSTALPLALLAVTSLRMTGVYSRDGGRAGGATGKLHRSFAAHRTRDSG
jgi:hypothetical protein